MTSPDLAANGWTIQKFDSPYTPYARAGEVDWSIASVTANTYRSSLINGVLVMQLPIGSGTQIGKATDAAARSYVSHAWNSLDTDNNYAFLANTSTYLENGKQTFYCGIEGQKFVEVLATGPATFNVIRNPAITLPQHNMQKWIHYDGANAKCQGANALDARAHSSTVLSTANTAITVPTYAGVVFTPSSRQLCFLDSIRRETSYAFP